MTELSEIREILASIAASQQRTQEQQERNTEAIARLEAAQERTQVRVDEVDQTADDNAQYLGETRAMLEQAIHGFRADMQAVVAVFAENIAAIREESNQRHDDYEQRYAESEARHVEQDQRFNNLLADARADRQRQDQRHQEWMQRFDEQLAEMRQAREEWSQRFDEQKAESDRRFDEQLAEMREAREANATEHRAFTQVIQTLLAEVSRIWQRLSA